MDKQKQIEEMAMIAFKNTLSYTCAKQIAMNFYNAGYRKESETAEKFAKRMKQAPYKDFTEEWVADEICKEITEGKV